MKFSGEPSQEEMAISVVVFDFDGTLVESNRLKYDAFFDLFPHDAYHAKIISQVLAASGEESRYRILEKILQKLKTTPTVRLEDTVQKLASRYNDIVVEGAKTCPECPGAETLLQELFSRYALYLSSTTPEEPLREVLSFRNWSGYFKDIFGYPRKKPETALRRHIADRQGQAMPDPAGRQDDLPPPLPAGGQRRPLAP